MNVFLFVKMSRRMGTPFVAIVTCKDQLVLVYALQTVCSPVDSTADGE